MARARQAAHNAPAVIPPQGRLTLTAATPVMTAEAANQTTIYYTPYVGDLCPIYNGSTWNNTQFAELSIAMAASANWAANTNYDLFVANDAGTLRLVTGPAWSSATARHRRGYDRTGAQERHLDEQSLDDGPLRRVQHADCGRERRHLRRHDADDWKHGHDDVGIGGNGGRRQSNHAVSLELLQPCAS